MNKFIFNLKKKERILAASITKHFLTNRVRIYLAVFLFLLSLAIIRLPYIGFTLRPIILYPIVVAIAVFLTRINIRLIIITVISIFIISPFLLIFNKIFSTELLGNTAFFLLLVVFLKSILKYKENINEKK